ncbi:DNA polymerase III subunit delta [Aphanothece hegewaldii CCALA 016]|uniref:DNA polymerase III subunit delta n=1 Tax=Aphanothece hegewaldii CCALA 016 TaxID=2107694 RepID=A0A2T1LT45_9CHRO|nr:DNA polymerase III subunit delta [Aphanothece hegewaldii]PSF33470.1 DNA polymerase III subunit delta [Aphanothece hegewaldii CCALA 016]
MSIYLLYGEDDYLLHRYVLSLKSQYQVNNNPFGFFTYSAGVDSINAATQELMTPPMSNHDKVILLPNTSWVGAMDEQLLSLIQKAIASMHARCVLISTTPKLDNRLKSVKYLKSVATEIKEFPLISPWNTKALSQSVRTAATDLQLSLTSTAVTALVEAIGNNTRLIYSDLEKLRLFTDGQVIEASHVQSLVSGSTLTPIDLAKAILVKDLNQTFTIAQKLSDYSLKTLSTLITVYRQWFWVKMLLNEGFNHQTIAQYLNLNNPGRVYYLSQEVKTISLARLKGILSILLETELSLKQGTNCLQEQLLKLILL